MSEYFATIEWARAEDETFTDKKYSRGHTMHFDEGLTVPASASPHSVPEQCAIARAVDPEEGFVASISSCHMLWFLAVAAKRGFVVDSYRDSASGTLEKDSSGKMSMTRVTLRPEVKFGNDLEPTGTDLESMHHEAHEECYIANSVNSEVVVEPVVSN